MRAGKPAEGHVLLAARLSGGRVQVSVEDDGRGLDLDAIRAKAQAQGWEVPEDAPAVARLIFRQGLSTALQVTSSPGAEWGSMWCSPRWRRSGAAWTCPSAGRWHALRAGRAAHPQHAPGAPGERRRPALRPPRRERGAAAPAGALRGARSRGPAGLGRRGRAGAAHLARLGAGHDAGAPLARLPAVVLTSGPLRVALGVDEVLAEQEVLVRGPGPACAARATSPAPRCCPPGRWRCCSTPPPLSAPPRASPPPRSSPRRRRARAPAHRPGRGLADHPRPGAEPAGGRGLRGGGVRRRRRGLGAPAAHRRRRPGVGPGDAPDGWLRAHRGRAGLAPLLPAARGAGHRAGRPEDKARGLQVGASAYLVKSAFDQTNLLETLRRLL